MEEVKSAVEALQKSVYDFRKEAEKATEESVKKSAEAIERLEKMAEDVHAQKERLDAIETKAKRPEFGDKEEKDSYHVQVFEKYARFGEGGLSPDEQKFAMETKASVLSDNSNAGYLRLPNERVRGILQNVLEFSPVRQLADVRSGSASSIEQPRNTAEVSASWVAESGTRSETTGLTFGMETITAHELYVQLHASRQMLADQDYDLESFFNDQAGRAFADAEATAFISGSGAGRPEGIVTNTSVNTKTGASSTAIAADELIDTFYTLKQPYRQRGSWLCTRAGFAEIMQLKDGSGQYLWRPGLQPGQPDMLLSRPVYEADDLDAPAAGVWTTGENVAIFGDFRAGYRIYDRIGMGMLRDPFNGASTGAVRFHFWRRVGGGVILPEALVVYKTA